jgi:hypothetical protein
MYKAAGDAAGGVPGPRSVMEAKVILAAARNGIKVYCAEAQSTDLRAHGEAVDRTNAPQGALDDAIKTASKIRDPGSGGVFLLPVLGKTALARGADPDLVAKSDAFNQTQARRFAGDAALAERIKEKSGGGAEKITRRPDSGFG